LTDGVGRLRLRNLHKSFGGTHALRGVDLDVAPGEIHGLVGENGAGKSTLIRCVGGVLQPDAGTIELDGERLTLDSPRAAFGRGSRRPGQGRRGPAADDRPGGRADRDADRQTGPRSRDRNDAWRVVYELAGVCGIDPGPLTLRELLFMAEARGRESWAHTSAILALIANVNRDPKKTRPFIRAVEQALLLAATVKRSSRQVATNLAESRAPSRPRMRDQ